MKNAEKVKAPAQVFDLYVNLKDCTQIKSLESVLPEGCWKQEGGYWSERGEDVGLPCEFNRCLTKEEVLKITEFLYDMGDNV